jgi:hypothetical protein
MIIYYIPNDKQFWFHRILKALIDLGCLSYWNEEIFLKIILKLFMLLENFFKQKY